MIAEVLPHGGKFLIVDKHNKYGSIAQYHASCSAKHSSEILGAAIP